MLPGFLPFSRASFMLDFVGLAMVVIIPLLTYSLFLAKVKRQFPLHKKLQLSIAIILAVAVLAFEIDMRVYGWRQYAEVSPYYDSILFPFLYFHILISTVTVLLWTYVIWQALRNFPNPPASTIFSPKHKKYARAAALGMYLTSFTGWIFYYMAFVA